MAPAGGSQICLLVQSFASCVIYPIRLCRQTPYEGVISPRGGGIGWRRTGLWVASAFEKTKHASSSLGFSAFTSTP